MSGFLTSEEFKMVTYITIYNGEEVDYRKIEDERKSSEEEEIYLEALPSPAKVLRVYLLEGKKEKLIGYIDCIKNRAWIKKDIFISFKKAQNEGRIEEFFGEKNFKRGIITKSFVFEMIFRDLIDYLRIRGYKVKAEYIGGPSFIVL